MNLQTSPSRDEMITAFLKKDSNYEGIFFTGVRTTGIFCRPTCTARKPLPENVEFFKTINDAVYAGYRPCKVCNPLELAGNPPEWIQTLLKEIDTHHILKLKDYELKNRGLDPERVRRWFNKHYGMTFQAYLRAKRLSKALTNIKDGDGIIAAAFESGYESVSGFSEAFAKIIGTSPGKGKDTQIVHLQRMNTPLGPMVAGSTNDALVFLEFSDRRMFELQVKTIQNILHCTFLPGANDVLQSTEQQLSEYFAGTRKTFSLPIYFPGTPFHQRVWKALQAIPYGETRSYAQLAKEIGQPTAVRAVANANGYNRIAIIIPCHRVIGSDGTLTGYGGKVWRKKQLLELESNYSDILRVRSSESRSFHKGMFSHIRLRSVRY